jgi:hypothetical protein
VKLFLTIAYLFTFVCSNCGDCDFLPEVKDFVLKINSRMAISLSLSSSQVGSSSVLLAFKFVVSQSTSFSKITEIVITEEILIFGSN